MNQSNHCEKCGGPLAAGALGGGCPRCLLEAGLPSEADLQRTDQRTDLQRTITAAPSTPGSARPEEHRAPTTIARYRIVRLIGEGGMGSVYEAEQENPRRTVALKVIKPGLASPALLRRFEQEAEALGRLQHPGIAQIHEAGTADTGFGPQPYFAMEFIHGSSLRDYAEQHHLNTRDRMEIMAKVCDAVHHAHQRGLIHRDLKPGNILVDETGQPKILDFGVARVTDRDAQATTQTDAGQLIGTLTYMSPEQVLADPLELDTRSDVYALGVILYELLAGRLPYHIGNKLHEALQAIREEDPARLSSVSHGYKGDVETIVAKALEKDKARRYSSAADFAADIRRYLTDEPIEARPPSVSYQLQKFARRHKALVAGVAAVFVVLVGGIVASTLQAARANREKDRATVAEQRATQARDLAVKSEQQATDDRNRAVAAEEQARQERDNAVAQKQRADTEAETAKAVQDFLGNDLLRMANPLAQTQASQPNQPAATPTPNLTVKEALDRAAQRISGKFDKQPLVEAAIRETIGGTYLGLGGLAEARDQLERAVALRRRVQGVTHADTLKSTIQLGQAYLSSRMFQKAEDLAKQVVLDARKGPGDYNPATRSAISLLVSSYTSSLNGERDRVFPEAERFLKNDILEYERRTLGDQDATTRLAISSLVNLYKNQLRPRYAEAEAFLNQLVEDQRRKLGADNPATTDSVFRLVNFYLIDEPQPKFAATEAFLKPLVDDDDPAIMLSITELIALYVNPPQLKYAEAEAFLKQALEEQRRKLGTANRATINSVALLGDLYFQQAKYQEAEVLLAPFGTDEMVAKVIEGGKNIAVDSMIRSLDDLQQIYAKQGTTAKADAAARKSKKYRDLGLSSVFFTSGAEGKLVETLVRLIGTAISYIRMDQDKDAEDALNTVLAGCRRLAGRGSSSRVSLTLPIPDEAATFNGVQLTATGLNAVARWYTEKGKDVQAEKILKTVVEINHDTLGDGDPNTHTGLKNLALWYVQRHRYSEGQNTYIHLIEIQSSSLGPKHPSTRNSMFALATAYNNGARFMLVEGKSEQVRQSYEKALEIESQLLAISRSDVGGENSSETLGWMTRVGLDYGVLGKYAQAEETFNQVLAIQRNTPSAQPAFILESIATLGWIQFHEQRYGEAGMNLRAALRGAEQLSVDTWERHNFESMLGTVLVAEKQYPEAEQHLLASYAKMIERKPRVYSPFITEVVPGERILGLYQEWGKADKVAEWKSKVDAAKAGAAR